MCKHTWSMDGLSLAVPRDCLMYALQVSSIPPCKGGNNESLGTRGDRRQRIIDALCAPASAGVSFGRDLPRW